MKQFYDGKIRPELLHMDWDSETLDRICLNCGKRFSEHREYNCFVEES